MDASRPTGGRSTTDGRPVEIRAATGRFDDFATVVGPKTPGTNGCWCMSYRDARLGLEGRIEHMRAECAGEPGPGVLAFVEGEAAGWCSVAPRSTYRRLMNSRTIPRLAKDGLPGGGVDERDPWSVVCFVVRTGFRRQGLMHALLDGAIEHVRAHGGGVMEAYPAENRGERLDVISGYVGTTELFESAGFARVLETTAHAGHRVRWLMRLEVAP